MKLLLVHGRDQQGKDPGALEAQWMEALERGLKKNDTRLPSDVEVAFPFYGDRLDAFTREAEVPLTADLKAKGGEPDAWFLSFEAELAEELRRRARVTDEQVYEAYGNDPTRKGPENWEWVQSIFRAIDKHLPGFGENALELFIRDVYLYSTRSGVQAEINSIVTSVVTEEPTVVVGHSLGSVVAYNVLRQDVRNLQVPLFITLGSPLGVRLIRNQLRPLRFPKADNWFNAYDKRDIVALNRLDERNFPVEPAIANYGRVDNHTENRHGIVGYLDDAWVAETVYAALTAGRTVGCPDPG